MQINNYLCKLVGRSGFEPLKALDLSRSQGGCFKPLSHLSLNIYMACLVGFSPTTYALEGHCSKITELQAQYNYMLPPVEFKIKYSNLLD